MTTETEESWRPGDGSPAFDTSIEAVLTDEGDTTTLVIETRGMPLEKIAFYGVGWQLHAEHLATYLSGNDPVDDTSRWDTLIPTYQRLAADTD